MSSFTNPLIVKVLDNGAEYQLVEGFEYYREYRKLPNIIVPKGFVTDFASVPRIFWSIFPPFGRYSKSAVLHDYLCKLFHNGEFKRKDADDIFLESMQAVGVAKFTRYCLYYSVRLYAIFKGYK